MTREHFAGTVILAKPDEPVRQVIQRMASDGLRFHGMSIVLDSEGVILGVLNNGDVLRLVARNADFDRPIADFMVRDPVTVQEHATRQEMIREVRRQLRERGSQKDYIKHLLVTDHRKRLTHLIDYVELLTRDAARTARVAVFGLGFVGLTLATALADVGHQVTGLDTDEGLISALRNGNVHVHEPRLSEMIRIGLETGALRFSSTASSLDHDLYIIAVGTPVGTDGSASPDLRYIRSAAEMIGKSLKVRDTVVVRSTVPVGTTRQVVLPVLERFSELRAGIDFALAFCPERTVEGKAMAELRELPQIVGGLTPGCRQWAATFWSSLAQSVVPVASLEAAELIKLINNTYRDISFAFSNAVAELSESYNLNAFQLVAAANEGYPRNRIASPSPGVGGYCLTKDPYLFAAANPEGAHAEFAKLGRSINQRAALHPVRAVQAYFRQQERDLAGRRAMVVGMAFKGWPATNDLRGSTSVTVAMELKRLGMAVHVWDAVVDPASLAAHGLQWTEYESGCQQADAILILNNHPDNVSESFLELCTNGPVLIYDGWSQLTPEQVERVPGLYYATAGYHSCRRQDLANPV